jgi:hypothetical protein
MLSVVLHVEWRDVKELWHFEKRSALPHLLATA